MPQTERFRDYQLRVQSHFSHHALKYPSPKDCQFTGDVPNDPFNWNTKNHDHQHVMHARSAPKIKPKTFWIQSCLYDSLVFMFSGPWFRPHVMMGSQECAKGIVTCSQHQRCLHEEVSLLQQVSSDFCSVQGKTTALDYSLLASQPC